MEGVIIKKLISKLKPAADKNAPLQSASASSKSDLIFAFMSIAIFTKNLKIKIIITYFLLKLTLLKVTFTIPV
jgi:hypothetical protein